MPPASRTRSMSTEVIWDAVRVIGRTAQAQVLQIPGMDIVVRYIKSSYQNDPFRVVLEALLVFFTLRYLLANPKQAQIELTKSEVDELVDEWEPEPLVTAATIEKRADRPEIVSEAGVTVKNIKGETLVNFVSQNYLGLHNSPRIKEIAKATVKEYGVGTCGPAGFYGTLDVHLKLEKELARVLGTESAIIYAQGYAALSSVIPAFSKRGDIIVADEQVCMAIQKGMQISRSRLFVFKHNDMEDLERVLQEVEAEDKKKGRALTRRFIIVEGLYGKTGEIAKLRNLITIKERFKYRLIVDETNSLGAIGPRALGLADYYEVPNSDIDIIVGSMSGVLGSAGGFCAGSEAVVDHQRLSSQAYCFSASLPAVLARSALETLLEIEATPELAASLRNNTGILRGLLAKGLPGNFEVAGHPDSPMIFVRFKAPLKDEKYERQAIESIVTGVEDKGVLVCCPALILKLERLLPRPAIRLTVSAAHSPEQLQSAAKALIEQCKTQSL